MYKIIKNRNKTYCKKWGEISGIEQKNSTSPFLPWISYKTIKGLISEIDCDHLEYSSETSTHKTTQEAKRNTTDVTGSPPGVWFEKSFFKKRQIYGLAESKSTSYRLNRVTLARSLWRWTSVKVFLYLYRAEPAHAHLARAVSTAANLLLYL
jgi:hypothetical protein